MTNDPDRAYCRRCGRVTRSHHADAHNGRYREWTPESFPPFTITRTLPRVRVPGGVLPEGTYTFTTRPMHDAYLFTTEIARVRDVTPTAVETFGGGTPTDLARAGTRGNLHGAHRVDNGPQAGSRPRVHDTLR